MKLSDTDKASCSCPTWSVCTEFPKKATCSHPPPEDARSLWRMEITSFREFKLDNLSAYKLPLFHYSTRVRHHVTSHFIIGHAEIAIQILCSFISSLTACFQTPASSSPGRLGEIGGRCCEVVTSPGSYRAGRCGTPPHSWAWGCGTPWWAWWIVEQGERGIREKTEEGWERERGKGGERGQERLRGFYAKLVKPPAEVHIDDSCGGRRGRKL